MPKKKADFRWHVSSNEVEAYLLQNRVSIPNEKYSLMYPLLKFLAYLQTSSPRTSAMRNAISFLNVYTHQNKIRNEPYFLKRITLLLNRDKMIHNGIREGYIHVRNSVTGRRYNRYIPTDRMRLLLVDMEINTMEQLKAYVWAIRFAYRMGLIEFNQEAVDLLNIHYK